MKKENKANGTVDKNVYCAPEAHVIMINPSEIICGSPEITNVANPFNGDVEEEEW